MLWPPAFLESRQSNDRNPTLFPDGPRKGEVLVQHDSTGGTPVPRGRKRCPASLLSMSQSSGVGHRILGQLDIFPFARPCKGSLISDAER